MAFNANDKMTKIKGRDYLEVKWRLVWFREEHPDWDIDTTMLHSDETTAIFACKIYDANGRQVSSGHGSESTKDWGDYIEKAETKAIGRALAMLGYGTQFAPELDEGDRIVDAPVARKKAPAGARFTDAEVEQAKQYISPYEGLHKGELLTSIYKTDRAAFDRIYSTALASLDLATAKVCETLYWLVDISKK